MISKSFVVRSFSGAIAMAIFSAPACLGFSSPALGRIFPTLHSSIIMEKKMAVHAFPPEVIGMFVDNRAATEVVDVAGLKSSSIMMAVTEPWVQPLSAILGPFLSLFSFAMLCRIVLSWYPSANVNELPFNLVVWPTEPLLRLVRGTVPPAFGVDVTPVVWLGIFTFLNEILLGQQGLLTMKMKYGI